MTLEYKYGRGSLLHGQELPVAAGIKKSCQYIKSLLTVIRKRIFKKRENENQ